jgi:hypothetical protein
VNGGFRERRKREPKFLFARILIFDAAIFGVLRHSGVKIEAYTVA